jgi:hypothetical protein
VIRDGPEWPGRDVVRWAAVAIAAVALAAAVYRVPQLVRIAHRYWDGPSYTTQHSDFDPLRFVVSLEALERARAVIPPDATYSVVVGDTMPLANDPIEIPFAFQFWLLPRRQTADPTKADWVIAYHHAAETLGVPYSRELSLGPDATVVSVTR